MGDRSRFLNQNENGGQTIMALR